MSGPARILPLAAVAVGGVLAFKALDAAGGASALFGQPSARAEEASAGARPHAGPGAQPGVKPAAAAAAAAKPPAPVCAPGVAELAREAGLSPAELSVIQSLSARRGQLDAREQALDTQLQLLAAAEVKVDAKIKALDAAKAQLQGLLGQADQQSQAEVDRLVVVYEKMKPRDSGALMAQLDERVRTPVAAKMKPAILAQVLSNMGVAEAKKLTETLARRFAAAREAIDAAANPAAAKPAAPAKPEARGAPVQKLAAAEPSAASDPTAKPDAAKPDAKPASKPRRLAKAAPAKPRPAKASPAKAAVADVAKADATKAPPAAAAAAKAEAKPPVAAPAKPAEKPAT